MARGKGAHQIAQLCQHCIDCNTSALVCHLGNILHAPIEPAWQCAYSSGSYINCQGGFVYGSMTAVQFIQPTISSHAQDHVHLVYPC